MPSPAAASSVTPSRPGDNGYFAYLTPEELITQWRKALQLIATMEAVPVDMDDLRTMSYRTRIREGQTVQVNFGGVFQYVAFWSPGRCFPTDWELHKYVVSCWRGLKGPRGGPSRGDVVKEWPPDSDSADVVKDWIRNLREESLKELPLP
jgi:hypothetical protein